MGMFDQIPEAARKKGLIGKRLWEDNKTHLDERAQAPKTSETKVSGNFIESVYRVELYESEDDMDRGGVVIVCRVYDGQEGFIPHVVSLEDGFELHLCGDSEARSVAEGVVRMFMRSRLLQKQVAAVVLSEVSDRFLNWLSERSERG